MTSYTTRSSYPYPDPSDQVADYPTTASAIANYLDHLPNRNAIINPVMDIWQRGTTFINPATGTYTADRWRIDYDGAGGTRTVARNNISLGTNLPSGIQGKYFLDFGVSNRGTATTQSISQRIEGVRTFAGETITLSAWVRNDDSGVGVNTVTAKAIQNFGTGGSPSTAVTTTLGTGAVTGTWVRLHVHATLPNISGKTIGNNGDDYLQIMFDVGSQTGKFWLYGVQVEQNTTQTALERRPIGQEVALCERYFQSFPTHTGGDKAFFTGVAYLTNTIIGGIMFPRMRGLPAGTVVSPTAFDAVVGNGVVTGLTLGLSEITPSTLQIALSHASAVFTAGHAAVVRSDGGYIQLSAEL